MTTTEKTRPPSEWWVTGADGHFTPFTTEGINALYNLDRSFVGTEDYMGYAYFWAYEYRHYLRSASAYRTRLVHKKLCEAGLPLDGESPEHLAIIKRWAADSAWR